MNGTVLLYWLGPRSSYLWVIAPDRISRVPLPPAAEIEVLVKNYQKALVSSRDVLATQNAEGSKLYELLVAPAQPLASDSRLIVIPDGILNNLNFETLLVPEPKLHFLVEDVTIVNGSSLRLLAAVHPAVKVEDAKLLLIGDATSPSSEYNALPNAAAEMHDIENHFAPGARRVYTGNKATPAAYLSSNPQQYSYIHFVAHGTASLLSPLDSAVVLAKSTTQEDSFKLYARDIIREPLHANLVTISTCYGAGARAYTGEGLVGLSWAFLRAGAHNVIGALWEVSDSSTPLLMNQMYTELGHGLAPDEALRAAKLSLLHSEGVYRKPFYWAPFQLYTGS